MIDSSLWKFPSYFFAGSRSYFTGKLEAYMRYRELRVERIEGTLEDLSRNIEVGEYWWTNQYFSASAHCCIHSLPALSF